METHYREWLERKNLSSRSVDQWTMILRRFTDWHGDPLHADTDDIETWLFEAQPHLAATTRRNYIMGLASFYRWAIREGLVTSDPTIEVVKPKEPILMPDPVPAHQVRQALDAASPVMRALLSLAAFGGLRCAEISALRWADIDRTQIRVSGKGRKQRSVPMHPDIWEALNQIRDGMPDDRVFCWSAAGISRHGCEYLRALGVTVRRPMHGLRSFFATRLYAASGHDLLMVRDMLGHTSVNTTALYAQVAQDAATNAVAGIAA